MNGLVETPWDRRAFGFDTYEITELTDRLLQKVESMSGHFTVRIPPLSSKKRLHDLGFYYCDTLIEPYCTKKAFSPIFDGKVKVKPGLDADLAATMCLNAFHYDRFHRDFHIPAEAADKRYDHWIRDIDKEGILYGLWYEDSLAGFFACRGSNILLHAIKTAFQGKGLAKYFWSDVCHILFDDGHEELTSSISATNMAVLNLYRSIGFSFRNPLDIYHKFNPPKL